MRVLNYRITAQRAADSNDPEGTQHYEGDNFPDLVTKAQRDGYPRIISGEEREVTPWQPIENYPFDLRGD